MPRPEQRTPSTIMKALEAYDPVRFVQWLTATFEEAGSTRKAALRLGCTHKFLLATFRRVGIQYKAETSPVAQAPGREALIKALYDAKGSRRQAAVLLGLPQRALLRFEAAMNVRDLVPPHTSPVWKERT